MAETLRELVVALLLDSSHFSRNMRTINQQIKEAESTFRLAGTGVENYEKTIAGTEAKLSMLGNKLTRQQRAVEQYSRALVAANEKLRENYDRHQDYSQRLEQTKARQEDLRFEVEAAMRIIVTPWAKRTPRPSPPSRIWSGTRKNMRMPPPRSPSWRVRSRLCRRPCRTALTLSARPPLT